MVTREFDIQKIIMERMTAFVQKRIDIALGSGSILENKRHAIFWKWAQ